MEPAYASCSTTGNYTGGSQYKKNLDQFLAALLASSSNGGFYKGSVGAGANAVFSLIMYFRTAAPPSASTTSPGRAREAGA